MKNLIKPFASVLIAAVVITALCACRSPVESVKFKEQYIKGNKLYISYTVCYELEKSEFYLIFKNDSSKKLNGSLSTLIKSENIHKGDYEETFDINELSFKSASKDAKLNGNTINRSETYKIKDDDVRIMLGNGVNAYIEARNNVRDSERFEVDIK